MGYSALKLYNSSKTLQESCDRAEIYCYLKSLARFVARYS